MSELAEDLDYWAGFVAGYGRVKQIAEKDANAEETLKLIRHLMACFKRIKA